MKQFCLWTLASLTLATVSQGQPAGDAKTAAPFAWGTGVKTLMISGGWAHDYETWFHKADTATLNKAGFTNILYTTDSPTATRELANADVVIWSCNQVGFDTPELRAALTNFVNAGKGLVIMHSGVWYNPWKTTDFCNLLVGGGATDHRGEAQFPENVVKQHAVTQGLPATFQITDEMYHMRRNPTDSPIEVLVETALPGEPHYASVWLTHYGTARIVCNALGHAGAAHNSPDYQKLLVNSVKWAAGQ